MSLKISKSRLQQGFSKSPIHSEVLQETFHDDVLVHLHINFKLKGHKRGTNRTISIF